MNDLLVLALLSAAWCALHSLLVTTRVTAYLRWRCGSSYRAYRMIFNLIALVTFALLFRYQVRIAGEVFFGWGGWWSIPRILMVGAALLLFLTGGRHYDLLQFLGVRQLMSGATGQSLTAHGGLDTSGALGLVRHPWYSGALLLIWARSLDASVVVFNVVLSAYLVVGTLLEERKLVAEFGDEYRRYQRRVPMLVPRWRPRRS